MDFNRGELLLDSKLINNFKLRGSYGSNGNLTSRYSSLARLLAPEDSRYVFGDGGTTVNGQTVVSLANPNLKWERTNGINVGLDFTLFDNFVTGSLDYYNSKTKDLLWDFILPELSGFSSIRSNIGEIQNTGWEAIVDFYPFTGEDFSWNFGINFSRNENKINELLGEDLNGDGREDDLISNGLFIGESIGSVYSYVVDGISQTGDNNIREGWEPGQLRLRDLNGDGAITPEGDREIIGRSEPAYQVGFKNSISYKDFTFNFLLILSKVGRMDILVQMIHL